MYDMHDMTKTKRVISRAGLSVVLLFCLHGMAQAATSGGEPNQQFSEPPVLPGVMEPPRFQGFTTESPGDFHYSPEMIEDMERKKRQIEEKGYIEISESQAFVLDRRMSNIQERKERHEHIQTLQDVQSTLGFQPAALQFSPLGKAEIIEATTSGSWVEGKWSEVNRLFNVKTFGLVALNEWDFTVDHGGVYVSPDAINQHINGFPATLSIGKSPSGHWLTTLAWYTETKVFELTANHPIKPQNMIDEFIQLAEGIQ